MPYKIEHKTSVTGSLTATSSVSTTPLVPYSGAGGAMIFVTGVSGAASITWYAAPDNLTTPVPVIDGGNNVTTNVVAGRAYYVPDSLFSAPFVAAVTNSGTVAFVMSQKG